MQNKYFSFSNIFFLCFLISTILFADNKIKITPISGSPVYKTTISELNSQRSVVNYI